MLRGGMPQRSFVDVSFLDEQCGLSKVGEGGQGWWCSADCEQLVTAVSMRMPWQRGLAGHHAMKHRM
jgi:hypothetical protein